MLKILKFLSNYSNMLNLLTFLYLLFIPPLIMNLFKYHFIFHLVLFIPFVILLFLELITKKFKKKWLVIFRNFIITSYSILYLFFVTVMFVFFEGIQEYINEPH